MPEIIQEGGLYKCGTSVLGAYDLIHEVVQLLLGASQLLLVRFVLTIPEVHPFSSPIVINGAGLNTTRQRAQQVDHQGGVGA